MVRHALKPEPTNPGRSFVAALAIVAAFAAAVVPTLGWLEFSSSMENLNAATVLQMRTGEGSSRDRFESWLLPTLEAEPRTAKPPLATWVTSAFVPQSTIARLDDADPAARSAAYERLAVQMRLSAIATSSLLLLATWVLSRRIVPDDASAAWIAVCVAASSLYLLRFGRHATTDVHLALWVTIANVCIASALLRRFTWSSAIGAGVALGMALMSKGPVALVQTIVPAAVFAMWSRWEAGRAAGREAGRAIGQVSRDTASGGRDDVAGSSRGAIGKIIVASIVMLAVGGSWYLVVLARDPSVWSQWLRETTRVGATDNKSANPFSYLTLFIYVMPWTIFFIIGLVESIFATMRRIESRGAVLALMFVAVPLVLMSFFPDRKERYLLPLLAPAASLAAIGVRSVGRGNARWPWIAHGAILAAIAIGLPLAGMLALRTIDHRPWYDGKFAAVAIAAGAAIGLVGCLASAMRFGAAAIVVTTLATMFLSQAVFMRGYRDTEQGRSEMRPLAELIRAKYPDARMFNWRRDGRHKRLSVDLSIYLNRPTIWTADPTTLPRSDHPQIVATLQNAGTPDPQPPPGWNIVGRVQHDQDWYWAFVRLPEQHDATR